MAFAENLLYYRNLRSLTQAELAEIAGINQPNLCNYEKGLVSPNIVTAYKLAQALHVTVNDLIYERSVHECQK